MFPRVLIVHASSHGQTRLIAEVIATEMRACGAEVSLCDALSTTPPPPDAFDAVLVGSRVHFGRHARAIRRYVRRYLPALNRRRTGFFSVSMSAAAALAADGAHADAVVGRFLAQTGWQPEWTATFAGAVRYRSYNPILRAVMKRISAAAGYQTDSSRDHDYTDFAAVGCFGETIARELAANHAIASDAGPTKERESRVPARKASPAEHRELAGGPGRESRC